MLLGPKVFFTIAYKESLFRNVDMHTNVLVCASVCSEVQACAGDGKRAQLHAENVSCEKLCTGACKYFWQVQFSAGVHIGVMTIRMCI